MRDVPMLFVSVMKSGLRRYRISVHRIPTTSEGDTRTRAAALAAEYVKLLEATVRRYPTQWYNYFDFWAQ